VWEQSSDWNNLHTSQSVVASKQKQNCVWKYGIEQNPIAELDLGRFI